MNIRPSSVADSKDYSIGGSSSKPVIGRTGEGMKVQQVDDSKEHASMKEVANHLSHADEKGGLHSFTQVSSSRASHLGVGRELSEMNDGLEGLKLDLEHDYLASPRSVEELKSFYEKFKDITDKFDRRSKIITISENEEFLEGDSETLQEIKQLIKDQEGELKQVSSFLDSLQDLETIGEEHGEEGANLRKEITNSFLKIQDSSEKILEHFHSIESKKTTPSSSGRDSGSEKGGERKDTPEYMRAAGSRPK